MSKKNTEQDGREEEGGEKKDELKEQRREEGDEGRDGQGEDVGQEQHDEQEEEAAEDQSEEEGASDDSVEGSGDGEEGDEADTSPSKTLFLTGLPGDCRPRELYNLFRFSPGFVFTTVCIPSHSPPALPLGHPHAKSHVKPPLQTASWTLEHAS